MCFQFTSRARLPSTTVLALQLQSPSIILVSSLRLLATTGMSTVFGNPFGATLHGHLDGFCIRPGSHQQNWLLSIHGFTNWTTTAPSYRSLTFTWLRCDTQECLLEVTRLLKRRPSLLPSYMVTSARSSSSL